jgi:hypothetical protein
LNTTLKILIAYIILAIGTSNQSTLAQVDSTNLVLYKVEMKVDDQNQAIKGFLYQANDSSLLISSNYIINSEIDSISIIEVSISKILSLKIGKMNQQYLLLNKKQKRDRRIKLTIIGFATGLLVGVIYQLVEEAASSATCSSVGYECHDSFEATELIAPALIGAGTMFAISFMKQGAKNKQVYNLNMKISRYELIKDRLKKYSFTKL